VSDLFCWYLFGTVQVDKLVAECNSIIKKPPKDGKKSDLLHEK